MRSDQIDLLTTVSAPVTHPSGAWACVATSRASFDADSYVGQLWRVPLDPGGEPRRITRGRADSSPRFSPDGSVLGFLRAPADGPPQLFVVEADGGEPLQVTDQRGGVSGFAFSPDGRSVAFVSRVLEEGRYGTVDDIGAGQEDPRHITTYRFQADGLGFTHGRRRQLFVVDLPDLGDAPPVKPAGRAAQGRDDVDQGLVPKPTQLTDEDVDFDDPVWLPDGSAVLTVAGRSDDREEHLRSELYRVPRDGGAPSRVDTTAFGETATIGDVEVSGDGATLFVVVGDLGESGLDFVGKHSGLWALPLDGGTPRLLTDLESTSIDGAPRAVGDGDALVLSEQRGLVHLLRVGRDGEVTPVVTDRVVTGADGIPGGDGVVVTAVTTTSAGDVFRVDGDTITPLTDFSAALREQTSLVEPRELVATSPDGYPVHGWVLTPPGDGPHPVLLVIHGGPFAAYHGVYFDEWQAYVAAGYAVVSCNPRGSLGYGQAHGRVIRGDMGNLDKTDILAFLDHALEVVPGLDAGRLGVMGGSYGGYMTAWIIGHEDRFAGAVVERGYLDPDSFVGASDIGWFFGREYNGTDRDRAWAQSPMSLTSRVSTPTLVVHSEQDYRCPISQAYRYYTELKLHGVEAELLVFPGEGHELSRSGTPWHRRQRFDKILDWWSRKLPV